MKKTYLLVFLVFCNFNLISQPVVEGTTLTGWANPPYHVIIPDEVLTIKAQTFIDNKQLVSVDFKNVTTIESGAFKGCSSLETVDMPNVKIIGARAMQGTRLKKVTIPKATHIGPLAFYNATDLISVELPSARVVDRGAFGLCNALTKVDLRNAINLERIGDPKYKNQSPFPDSKRLIVWVPENKISLFSTAETRKYKIKM